MAGSSRDHLVWLDMEMTGLDPQVDVPLQVAIVITDSELNEQQAMEMTIWQPESALEAIRPFVRKMHTDNGLLKQVRSSTHSLRDAEHALMEILSKWCPFREGILAGNSIHADRRFLEKYFPVVDGYLHYRMVDVSSLKELVRRWYGQYAVFGKNDGKHTALSDVRDSIAELKHYRRTVFGAGRSAQASSAID
jgi:oligoribonuclease